MVLGFVGGDMKGHGIRTAFGTVCGYSNRLLFAIYLFFPFQPSDANNLLIRTPKNMYV
jgi:hypothetical protein